MGHPRKISLAESWGSSRFFISKFFFVFHFDHFLDFGFGTIIDGAKGGSVMAKLFRWVKLVGVNRIKTTFEIYGELNEQIFSL